MSDRHRACPKCGYSVIAQDREGWFCLNGGCGRFDEPVILDEEVSDDSE